MNALHGTACTRIRTVPVSSDIACSVPLRSVQIRVPRAPGRRKPVRVGADIATTVRALDGKLRNDRGPIGRWKPKRKAPRDEDRPRTDMPFDEMPADDKDGGADGGAEGGQDGGREGGRDGESDGGADADAPRPVEDGPRTL
jgi:hypothetical protein